jgi:hypothetical protein
MGGSLHVGGDPLRVEPLRHALGPADEAQRVRARAHADEHTLPRGPDGLDPLVAAVDAHLRVDAVRRLPEGELAQRDEIALPEEVAERLLGLLGDVDLALAQSLQEVVGGEVDQLDFVGLVENRVGHRLPDHDARDLGDHVVQALEMLDVERGVDVDARVEELTDVLPALGVTAPGCVGVRQLVDQDQRGMAPESRVEVELTESGAAIFERAWRKDLESREEGLGLGPTVGLHDAGHDVHAVGELLAGGLEHRVGLADAGRGSQEDLQPAPAFPFLLGLHAGEERVGIGPPLGHGSECTPVDERACVFGGAVSGPDRRARDSARAR